MVDNVRMTTIGGVRIAHRIEDREYREIEGTGIAVDRVGRVYMDEDFPETDNFPWLTVPMETGIFRAHVPAAVALAWLTEEDREAIRSQVPSGLTAQDPRVKDQVKAHNVWARAVMHVANTPENDLVILDEKPLASWVDADVRRIENASVENYRAIPKEHSRPPSKGGNTTALHRHTFEIDGKTYGFLALGSKRFVFAKDTVSFDYYETEEGYLNVIKHTIVCRDAKGKIQRRGNRGSKTKLRTAPTRLPGSRREARS